MNYKMIARFFAFILGIEAILMLQSLGISIYDGTSRTTWAFVITVVATGAVAALMGFFSRRAEKGFYVREGLLCVGMGWILMSLFGCLPFWISGEIPAFVDALFEIVSGFTTTGASILANSETLTRASLYWRSFSHWLGGMGVLVFLLAVIPISRGNEGFTIHLMRAESTGPSVGKLVPKMRQTAAVLYIVYVVMTVINVIFLLLGNMDLFEALCTAFGTAGTGGFGVKADSMGSYSPYIQTVTAVFMLLFGINFSCFYLLLLRQVKSVLKDEELRLYLGLVIGATLLITLNLLGTFASVGETILHAFFQVSSLITTTGFSTVNYDLWPSFSKAILLILMMIGSCAGSTGGGFKCIRLLLLFKNMRRNLSQIIRPRRVRVITVNGKTVDESLIATTNSYFSIYMVILLLSFVVVSLDGFSIATNFSAVIACFNNIGPGFEAVGPACNFSAYSVLSKLVLILDMLAGRLEIYPILILFNYRTWKKR
ncbi:MAG: TrkH family potassium uptake protein [Clostridia bacterium]|nr:TrkH family potassium uptake protein [Clostridia bacterium]